VASASKPYRRLPGTGYRYLIPGWTIVLLFFVIGIFALFFRGRRVQLWQGEEHLLFVEWDGSREYYKRFPYRDIQAFIVQRTNEGRIISAILAAVVLIFGALALAAGDPGGRIALLVVAGFFGLLLLGHALSGPTCKGFIRTAEQLEELPSLTRLRRFRKEAAQGQLASEEIQARMQEASQTLSGGETTPGGTVRYVVDDPNAPPRIIP
jgi:TM2 domain-containing membrane protein YozV